MVWAPILDTQMVGASELVFRVRSLENSMPTKPQI